MLSSLFYLGLDAVGIPRAARLSRRAGTILCYHNVVPGGAAGESATPDLHMPLARFESQVRWLARSEEHTSELQSRLHLVCRLLLEKKKKKNKKNEQSVY